MYQSVCLISEERNECVIATEVSSGLNFPLSMSPPAFVGGKKNALVTSNLIPEGVGQRSLPWCVVALGCSAGPIATQGLILKPGDIPYLAAMPVKGT